MATARTHELRAIAERIAAAFPPLVEEVVLTGSVSRSVADEFSDIEMLIVTSEQLEFSTCFEHARNAGLERLDSWGPQGTATSRVFGYTTEFRSSWSGRRASMPRLRWLRSSPADRRQSPRLWPTASPCGPSACWGRGRSASGTIRRNFAPHASRKPR